MAAPSVNQHPASFRDPCGYVVTKEGVFYRLILDAGAADYELLMQSGLYEDLRNRQLIIAHEEVANDQPGTYRVLKPQQLPFWTYPYEWSFSQLKDAALTTIELVKTGLAHGMILKDASAYNIQFVEGKPLLIDSLSFEAYNEGEPWQAFNQFCRHFLYPLLVFRHHPELSPAMLTAYSDGLPVQLTAGLLPWKSRLSMNNQLYVYLAAALSGKKAGASVRKISRQRILQNLAQLKAYIQKLEPNKSGNWSNYYAETILSDAYLQGKMSAVVDMIRPLNAQRLIDAGCNTGAFSIAAAAYAREVIAFDFDPASIDALYRSLRRGQTGNIQPLVADLLNPTPSLGWANAERSALLARLQGDAVLALALIHHLALAKNVPLSLICALFARMTGRWLVIEFVPKSDPKAQELLASRKDIFADYTEEHFEEVFAGAFAIEQKICLPHSTRTLYLMQKR